jgi:hypothetical protein
VKAIHNLIVSCLLVWSKRMGNYRLRRWIQLEHIKERILKAVENGQPDFPDYLLSYITTALGVPCKFYEKADWQKIVLLFYVCLSKSPHVELPLTSPTKETFKDEPWSYDGRMWHIYSHILASAYGWTLEYISQLQVEEALAKIQEVLTETQLEHEFYYGLSEMAYPYDKNSKKSIFKPMDRPHWMRPTLQPIPRFKIAKSVMPVGNIVDAGVLSEEYLPKEIIH